MKKQYITPKQIRCKIELSSILTGSPDGWSTGGGNSDVTETETITFGNDNNTGVGMND